MRHRLSARFLVLGTAVLMVLCLLCPVASAQSSSHGYGLKAVTEAEKKQFEKTGTTAQYVLPNALAIQRINEARSRKGLAPLSESLAVPAGQEMLADKSGASRAQQKALGSLDNVILAIPAAVDNSTRKAFPTIGDQGRIGSCASFAVTYYMATYELATARKLDAKSAANQLSPKFTYNLLNGGKANMGSSIIGNLDILFSHGALTMSQFPYDSNYTAWPTRADLWRSAYANEPKTAGALPILDMYYVLGADYGLSALKQTILDGKLLAFGTYIDHWTLGLTADTPAADDHPGENIAISMRPVTEANPVDGHAMAIVGYNDNIWVDADNDGQVDANEKGALKVANSWGTAWSKGNAGFIWVSYEAIKDYSMQDSTNTKHPSVFSDGYLFYMTYSAKPYAPAYTAEINLTTANRNQLTTLMGINWAEADEPCSEGEYWDDEDFYLINYYGDYAFWADPTAAPLSLDGKMTAGTGSIVVDMTGMMDDLMKKAGGALTFCLGIEDGAKAGDQAVNRVVFRNEKTLDTFKAQGLPYKVSNGMKWFSSRYIVNPGTKIPLYSTDIPGLEALQTGVPVTKTYNEGQSQSWKFAPKDTGVYRIAQTNRLLELGIENEYRYPLLLTNDPKGAGNILATLYGGRTYVIDAKYEGDDYYSVSGNKTESVFPITATVTLTKVSSAPVSAATADLKSISGAISPVFNPGVYNYSLLATGRSTTVQVAPADIASYVTVDRKVGNTAAVSLETGETKTVRIDVFARDWSKTKTYLVSVTRPQSGDASLSAIQATAGKLSPAFKSNIKNYTLTLGENEDSTLITPVTRSSRATYKMDGNDWPSEPVKLANGAEKTVTIAVTSQTGATSTYTVKVVREKSGDNHLKSLTASAGTFKEAFDPVKLQNYTLLLDAQTQKVTIKAVRASKYAVLKPTSVTISVRAGNTKTVTFKVRAQNGKTLVYTVKIIRAKP